MTKGSWKYKKAQGHHHVLMGQESLDVQSEADARAIAALPQMVKFLRTIGFGRGSTDNFRWWARQILSEIKPKQ